MKRKAVVGVFSRLICRCRTYQWLRKFRIRIRICHSKTAYKLAFAGFSRLRAFECLCSRQAGFAVGGRTFFLRMEILTAATATFRLSTRCAIAVARRSSVRYDTLIMQYCFGIARLCVLNGKKFGSYAL